MVYGAGFRCQSVRAWVRTPQLSLSLAITGRAAAGPVKVKQKAYIFECKTKDCVNPHPVERVMILQSVLQLMKRLKELPSAGYALGGRQADNTVLFAVC